MRKILFILICLVGSVMTLSAQDLDKTMMKVYCEVKCVKYNILKDDVNVLVDFGIADKAENAFGWIYDFESNKKKSFASPMSVIAFMAKNGWEYKDTVIKNKFSDDYYNNYLFFKSMPVDCTPQDIVGTIDYRNN